MIGNISTPGGIRPVRFGAGIGAIGGDTYRQAVVNTGPVSYWRLGEPSGTVAVDEMGAHNGTYGGGPTLGVAGALIGDSNTAVTYPAGKWSNLIGIPSAAAWSAAIWVETPAVGVGTFINFIYDDWPTDLGAWCLYGVQDATNITYYFGTISSGQHNASTAARPWDAGWHFIVGTYDGATIKVYADGALGTTTASLAGVLSYAAANDTIYNGAAAFTADEPAIWDRALSAAEVAALWAIGRGTW